MSRRLYYGRGGEYRGFSERRDGRTFYYNNSGESTGSSYNLDSDNSESDSHRFYDDVGWVRSDPLSLQDWIILGFMLYVLAMALGFV